MKSSLLYFINRAIIFCFYLIFFITPLVMFPSSYELFEFNKMWFVFMISLVIFFLWVSKIIITKKLEYKKTPFDIFLLLFLGSQFLSTIISLDPHTSFWGYYSRFNGGFLSILNYIFLYFAFVNNVILNSDKREVLHERDKKLSEPHPLIKGQVFFASEGETSSEKLEESIVSYKIIFTSFLGGILVALWGLPSHFGYDPTCLVFRGTFDVSCWTDAFRPKVRMFSTLGQPNWLAAYLSVLIPIGISFTLSSLKKLNFTFFGFLTTTLIFYLCLIYSNSQSGFLGFWAGNFVFFALLGIILLKNRILPWKEKAFKILIVINLLFLTISFFQGTPINQLESFTFKNIINKIFQKQNSSTQSTNKSSGQQDLEPPIQTTFADSSITSSGTIRKIVWAGALEIFRQNALLGTGVETYAFAYYKVKPKEHNLTSEWDFLYNKAHNEYLNFMATTGILGIGTYLALIFYFLYFSLKTLISNFKFQISNSYLPLALISAYISILVSNFFGFSVVMINIFFFLIPLFFYLLTKKPINEMNHAIQPKEIISTKLMMKRFIQEKRKSQEEEKVSFEKFLLIALFFIFVVYLEITLIRFWIADKNYALGYNLNRIGEYAQAYKPLSDAVELRPEEYIYKDELSSNLAALALSFYQQKDTSNSAKFAQDAITLTDEVTENNPNNVTFAKTRTRIYYTLSEIDINYFPKAAQALEKARELAPTDVKILYNLAIFYEQAGKRKEALDLLTKTTDLKPNYRDAYYALAVFYNQMAKEEKNPNLSTEYKNKVKANLDYIFKNIDPKDRQAEELLKSL